MNFLVWSEFEDTIYTALSNYILFFLSSSFQLEGALHIE